MWLWSNSIDFISEGIQFGGSSHLQQDWVGMDFLQQVKEAWAIIVFFITFCLDKKKVKEKHTQVSYFWVLLNIEHTPPTQFFFSPLSFCEISLLVSFIEKTLFNSFCTLV